MKIISEEMAAAANESAAAALGIWRENEIIENNRHRRRYRRSRASIIENNQRLRSRNALASYRGARRWHGYEKHRKYHRRRKWLESNEKYQRRASIIISRWRRACALRAALRAPAKRSCSGLFHISGGAAMAQQ